MRPGRFVTFEGGEGAGKSTQLAHLAASLGARGLEVLATREPGGTAGAEAIRGLLVDGPQARWRPLAELYLFLAARADSTRVYQGIAGGLGLELVDALQAPLLGQHRPDLTVLLDLPVEVGLARCAARGGSTRFEAKGMDFHQRVRAGFLGLVALEPERFAVVDASGDEATVAGMVWRVAAARLGLEPG
jgi:dTMP kinase